MLRFYLAVAASVALATVLPASEPQWLKQPVQKIAMAGVEGRIDHMAVDLRRGRLFVAALGNHTVEVLDLGSGIRVHRISGLEEPQGIAYISATDRVVVASGGDGCCRFFDGRTYKEKAKINLKEDADNVRYDANAGRVYVGYGKGALAVIDGMTMERIADIPLAGHPESFQLETKGQRIFVNVPTARHVAVVDRENKRVVATWPVREAEANFPMALDEANHRLLIGCRKPAKMLAIDTRTGKVVGSLACSADTDDLFYDSQRRRIYLTGGDGSISAFGQADQDHCRLLTTVATAAGARTSLFIPAIGSLCVAVPHREAQGAEIWIYRTSTE